MSKWRNRCFPYHPHCQLLCCLVLKTEPTAANTRPRKLQGHGSVEKSWSILMNLVPKCAEYYKFLNLVVTERSQYALGRYAPVFPIRSIFTLCGPSKKHSTCQKQSPKSVDFFQQSTTKQRKRYVLKVQFSNSGGNLSWIFKQKDNERKNYNFYEYFDRDLPWAWSLEIWETFC